MSHLTVMINRALVSLYLKGSSTAARQFLCAFPSMNWRSCTAGTAAICGNLTLAKGFCVGFPILSIINSSERGTLTVLCPHQRLRYIGSCSSTEEFSNAAKAFRGGDLQHSSD